MFSNLLFLGQSSVASFYLPQDIGGIAYFELPFSIMGNNIKSYGGYLSYILNYRGRGQGPNNSPDIIIIVSLLTTFFMKKWKTNSEFFFSQSKWLVEKNTKTRPVVIGWKIGSILNRE